MENNKKKNINIRVSDKQSEEIKEKAEALGMSLTEFVLYACYTVNDFTEIKADLKNIKDALTPTHI